MGDTLTLYATSATIEGQSQRLVEVNLTGIHTADLLENVDIQHVLEYFEAEDLLDIIGKQKAMEHFDLEETE